MTFSPRIYEKLKNLPLSPGVYLMKNEDGTIIYVGKSKALKNRVSQYFQHNASHTGKTRAMVSHICDFDYILTDTEAEALALECNLIKKYSPRYNILLKDDKQYPYIKITVNEDFPKIMITRQVTQDGALYYGPYMSGYAVKDTVEVIRKIFKIRSCNKVLPRDIGKGRPCLMYHLKRCNAPCSGFVSKEDYRAVFDKIEDVLKGNITSLSEELEIEMYKASERLEFEKAAMFRDKIESLKVMKERQKITSAKRDNRDVVGIYFSGNECCVRMFYIRNGKTIGTENFVFQSGDNSEEEVLGSFIKQFYHSSTDIPAEIIIPMEIDEMEDVEKWLSENCGHKVRFNIPKKGDKARFLKMAEKNAEEAYKVHRFKYDKEQLNSNEILVSLKNLLKLEKAPCRIECYDISNISGRESVGAEIVYENAKPCRKKYRKYNIKSVDGANDYASMKEVIFRRFGEAYKEEELLASGQMKKGSEKFLPLPDLILLDGGKGHVSAVRELLSELEEDIPVFGLVKDDKHKTRGITDEYGEYGMSRDSSLFKFLFSMQEEVHRFAVTAFRKKHTNVTVSSELEKINGVGPEKRKKLLKYFGSVKNISKAKIEELELVIDLKTAKEVFDYFNK